MNKHSVPLCDSRFFPALRAKFTASEKSRIQEDEHGEQTESDNENTKRLHAPGTNGDGFGSEISLKPQRHTSEVVQNGVSSEIQKLGV